MDFFKWFCVFNLQNLKNIALLYYDWLKTLNSENWTCGLTCYLWPSGWKSTVEKIKQKRYFFVDAYITWYSKGKTIILLQSIKGEYSLVIFNLGVHFFLNSNIEFDKSIKKQYFLPRNFSIKIKLKFQGWTPPITSYISHC